MALLDDNRKVETKPRPGQERSLNRPDNPDWRGGQERGPVNRQDTSTGRFSRPTIDQDYAYQAFRENLLGPLGLGDNSAKTDKAKAEANYAEEAQAEAQAEANQAIRNAQTSARRQVGPNSSSRKQLPKINLLGGDIKAKATATRITVSNATWIGYTWAFVQLPLAVLSILSFGIVSGLDSLLNTDKMSEYSSVLGWMAAKAAGIVATAIDSIAKFIGLDFAEIAFSIGAGLYMVVMALGLISILAVYFQYMASGLRPTTGRGSGLKTGALLLTIIGYCTPMLNIFPFIFLWMAAVWYHPK